MQIAGVVGSTGRLVVLVTQATAATLIFETEGFIDANYLVIKALFETACLGLQIKNYSADLETKHFRNKLVDVTCSYILHAFPN